MPVPTSDAANPFSAGSATACESPVGSPTSGAFSPQDAGLAASPSCIPPAHPARTLVLCFDGTGDQFDADNSNVVQFFSMLKKDDRRQQMVYYQAGIGTYVTPQIATPFASKISKTLDEMIAWNLDAHVMGGYEFLMQNYEAGDKICIFGFSRGAYTARALAGMIHKVGLLPTCNHQQVPFAYKMYTRTTPLGWAQSTLFKKAFSMDVDIEFIGVWDTVCSVGLFSRRLPFTTSNMSVKTFRHAVSLDERRAKFKANLFNWPQEEERRLGTQPGDMPKAGQNEDQVHLSGFNESKPAATAADKKDDKTKKSSVLSKFSNMSRHNSVDDRQRQREMERQFSEQERRALETDVLEVWFAGCHCDVGGGSVSNDTRHSLARIPLRWMVRQCFMANTGIRFHAELLRGIGLDPAVLYPVVHDRSEALYYTPSAPVPDGTTDARLSEEEEDLADALSPVYDQLALARSWWVLELLPMRHRVQRTADGRWETDVYANMGRARVIPKQETHPVYVHRSVKMRMEAERAAGRVYEPRARFDVEPTWVA
ncbi:uncharacterized protein PHACADRAFT_248724 [Phanerochaete carnosa HHB-10118-sp]|uniref:T6SS Phospholipase effector Tle1-like catalytic domain-containing protein n=1 Tax=Phanerochaete carnosa (strain HHB-10118-sp) TaxID=650164 RepID=K5VFR6_PHACS|nr:uncharacterized protein PHACADRAFT_248724 [Phanerochaete carnosa HHB-10118-sp]EKM61846.1 hypothetical protein PHACADRAFT_248724 [Phanerochaete carnosa HHB-10118-sp]